MKRMIVPLALAALLSLPFLAQAEGMGVYVAPKMGFGYLKGYDAQSVYWDDEDKHISSDDSNKIGMGSDTVFGGGIAVGYDFKRMGVPVRAELEYAVFGDAKSKRTVRKDWLSGDYRTSIGIQTLFANAYYDFHNSSAFTPYVGLGLGLSFVEMKGKYNGTWNSPWGSASYSDSYGTKSTTNFAWNLGGGVSYAITNQIGLDLGYRFVWIGKGETKKYSMSYSYAGNDYVDTEYFKTKDLKMHQVMLGMRYTF